MDTNFRQSERLLNRVNEIIINAKNNMKTININLDNNILNKIEELKEYVNLSKDISRADKDRILKITDELEDEYWINHTAVVSDDSL